MFSEIKILIRNIFGKFYISKLLIFIILIIYVPCYFNDFKINFGKVSVWFSKYLLTCFTSLIILNFLSLKFAHILTNTNEKVFIQRKMLPLLMNLQQLIRKMPECKNEIGKTLKLLHIYIDNFLKNSTNYELLVLLEEFAGKIEMSKILSDSLISMNNISTKDIANLDEFLNNFYFSIQSFNDKDL